MNLALFYLSATGNTRLVCTYLKKRIPGMELFDITKVEKPELSNFDIVGFAFPVFYLGIPPVLSDFIETLDKENSKPAFLLSTYGLMQGKALSLIGDQLKSKGFTIMDYHTLPMPESYPPFIFKGWTDTNAPDQKELLALDNFIESVKKSILEIEKGGKPVRKKIKIGFFNSIIPVPSDSKNRRHFGSLSTDEKLCTSCGKCINSCAYQAIVLDGKPVFDMNICRACFACFNKCPRKAISTSAYQSLPQYPLPDDKLEEKFI